eukprot:TRINITY_DN87499_c0_g1_i1.p1 TRINITY_DN87499_c0_g1~~TRINITY_DN87499_c0_g1_i1.p1  ORF type:complete len:460 (+),score=75.36 TRINITY_DN87499_c0_g1_i1:84-1463(+)
MFQGPSLGNRFIFPAPDPSYGPQSYRRHLCWVPWNPVISEARTRDPKFQDGIPCLWFPAPKAATVILFFHANAEDLGMSFAILKHMRDQFKVNVLAVEYPGYGLLNGMETDEEGIYEVALTTFRFLVDVIGVGYSQIILFGRSLGSGPAVYLASQYPVGGLILVSAFSSIRAAVQSIVGRVFAFAFKERFPNSQIIANVSCSTLFIHGEADGLIPMDHSLRLFKRCRARKLLVTPSEMEHNSNLFGDASFLAVPAIHFFGFPGYYTPTPPRLPASMFETPERRARQQEAKPSPMQESSPGRPWLCDCLAKRDQGQMDVGFARAPESVENITIRFFDSTTDAPRSDMQEASSSSITTKLEPRITSETNIRCHRSPGRKDSPERLLATAEGRLMAAPQVMLAGDQADALPPKFLEGAPLEAEASGAIDPALFELGEEIMAEDMKGGGFISNAFNGNQHAPL